MLHERELQELQRIKRVLEKGGERVENAYRESTDPEIQRYIDALILLRSIGAFEVHVPKGGSIAVIENTVGIKKLDDLTEKKLRDSGLRIRNVLGFQWASVPTLIGPREVLAPRYHPRQKALLDRVRSYYKLKKRASWQLDQIEEWFAGGFVSCSYTQAWRDYGLSMLLPADCVSHQFYINPKWYVLGEACEVQELSKQESKLA